MSNKRSSDTSNVDSQDVVAPAKQKAKYVSILPFMLYDLSLLDIPRLCRLYHR